MTINDHAVPYAGNPMLSAITVGKLTVDYRQGSELFVFTDTNGMLRKLDDPSGNVARMLEAIIEGPGETITSTVSNAPPKPGLPANNVKRAGESILQRPYLERPGYGLGTDLHEQMSLDPNRDMAPGPDADVAFAPSSTPQTED